MATQPQEPHDARLFGQLLVKQGVLSAEQLAEVIHKQQTTMAGKRFGEVAVRMGFISKHHITEGLSNQLGIPIVKLADREIPERIRNLIEPNIAKLYRVVPLGEENGVLVVAMADPTNVNHIDNLERLLERSIEPNLAPTEEISVALNKYYGLNDQTVETMLSSVSSASTMSTLSTMSNVSSMQGSSLASLSEGDMSMSSMSMDSMDMDDALSIKGEDDDEADSPVVKYVHNLILEAFRLRASDIHIEPGKYDVKIRYRIDGVLHQMPNPTKRAQASIVSRLKIMSGMNIAERRLPQDGRIKIALGGKLVDLRVNSLPSVHGETIVMRILDKSGLLLGLGQLGFSPDNQKIWEELLGESTGVILVTGPTGSGKTTTLYASLHKLNQVDSKLITVEDPVEYQIAGINQVQIHHDIGMNFSRALRTILRQDPDIVMVGEIRDSETAEIAIKAAMTGHLVFSTLHTNDAPSAFIRLIDQGVKPFLVATGVKAILAQRLVRTICTTCKETYVPSEVEVAGLGFPVEISKHQFFRGAGCDNCKHTGYQGRIACHELMRNNDSVRDLIMKGTASGPLKREARVYGGMKTMRDDGWLKILQGITTVEEVIRVTQTDENIDQAKKNLDLYKESIKKMPFKHSK